ncbi:GAF domain-containing protein [Plantactinospora solaniradicis]|uniref:GAF domain-containing protein n=1 Tax=Plantactinospora solaniradicis TaxID=1723736 RepID=A0ABW1KPC4_9ACTN
MTPDELMTVVAALARRAGDDAESRGAGIAAAIHRHTGHRWVGVYRVTDTEVQILGYSGPGAPAYPRFPRDQGLTATAVATGRSVVVDDVGSDPRYLTAFGSTRSEMIVPVLHPDTGVVLGTIDVESERTAAFGAEIRELLERCAAAVTPLYDADPDRPR